jgi:hypothetical protein
MDCKSALSLSLLAVQHLSLISDDSMILVRGELGQQLPSMCLSLQIYEFPKEESNERHQMSLRGREVLLPAAPCSCITAKALQITALSSWALLGLGRTA